MIAWFARRSRLFYYLALIIINTFRFTSGKLDNSFSESVREEEDSYYYKDELYDQLAYAYMQEIVKSRTTSRPITLQNFEDQVQLAVPKTEIPITTESIRNGYLKQLIFLERANEIQCENPWFWNSFECILLDVTNRYYSIRLRHNAIVASSISIVFFLGFCVCCTCIFCVVKRKISRIFNNYKRLHPVQTRTKNKAGVFQLPNDEIRLIEARQNNNPHESSIITTT